MFIIRKLTAIGFFGLAAFALHHAAHSDELQPAALAPIEAGSIRLGGTHLVAFYTPQDGQCAVTAVIEESVDEEPSASPARIRFDLAPGARAYIDDAGGKSVALECGSNAEMLRIERQGVTAALGLNAGS
jgi:hypothetical protein